MLALILSTALATAPGPANVAPTTQGGPGASCCAQPAVTSIQPQASSLNRRDNR